MSSTRFISSLAAVLGVLLLPLMAAAQTMADAPGVTVTMNGSTVLHRTPVSYPAAAQKQGVQGTLAVEVKVDSTGNVSDARVLSGPDELRKAVLESVLQWHFTRDAAGTTRQILIAFELPKQDAAERYVSGLRGDYALSPPLVGGIVTRQGQAGGSGGSQPLQGHIKSIKVEGLPEQASAELLASLPVHEGDEIDTETMLRANQAMKAFDEHLTMQLSGMERTPSGAMEVGLVLSVPGARSAAPGVPARIKVSGNVQSAMIVNKVPPVYPPLAKAAGVSGVVRLSAVLGKDGAVQELHVLEGPPVLIPAAVDAVKQWVYRPTLLNGQPVEVETTIDINFTLAP
jgi:TonB family protein